MNPMDAIDYGLAAFTIAGLLFIVSMWTKRKRDEEIAEIIQNNTKALQELTNVLQITLTRQEAKLDEILERVRSDRE